MSKKLAIEYVIYKIKYFMLRLQSYVIVISKF